jgi:hypothetical protein
LIGQQEDRGFRVSGLVLVRSMAPLPLPFPGFFSFGIAISVVIVVFSVLVVVIPVLVGIPVTVAFVVVFAKSTGRIGPVVVPGPTSLVPLAAPVPTVAAAAAPALVLQQVGDIRAVPLHTVLNCGR